MAAKTFKLSKQFKEWLREDKLELEEYRRKKHTCPNCGFLPKLPYSNGPWHFGDGRTFVFAKDKQHPSKDRHMFITKDEAEYLSSLQMKAARAYIRWERKRDIMLSCRLPH